jgi:hypothetical protein
MPRTSSVPCGCTGKTATRDDYAEAFVFRASEIVHSSTKSFPIVSEENDTDRTVRKVYARDSLRTACITACTAA